MPELLIHCGFCHCRVFSSVPGLCTLDAWDNVPVMITKIVSRHCQTSLRVSKIIMPVSHWFRDLLCVICAIASKSMRLLKPHQAALLDLKVLSMKQWKLR